MKELRKKYARTLEIDFSNLSFKTFTGIIIFIILQILPVSREPVFQIIIAIIYLILETRKGKGIPPKQQVGSELETADYQKFQVNKFLPI